MLLFTIKSKTFATCCMLDWRMVVFVCTLKRQVDSMKPKTERQATRINIDALLVYNRHFCGREKIASNKRDKTTERESSEYSDVWMNSAMFFRVCFRLECVCATFVYPKCMLRWICVHCRKVQLNRLCYDTLSCDFSIEWNRTDLDNDVNEYVTQRSWIKYIGRVFVSVIFYSVCRVQSPCTECDWWRNENLNYFVAILKCRLFSHFCHKISSSPANCSRTFLPYFWIDLVRVCACEKWIVLFFLVWLDKVL